MKKKIIITLGIVLIVVVGVIAVIKLGGFASRPDGTADTMELSEVSGLVLEKGYTQEEIEEKLKGEHRDNILVSWGEPDGMLSGFWGDIWFLDENENTKITLYYDANGCVEYVRIDAISDYVSDLIYGDTALNAALGLTQDELAIYDMPEDALLNPGIINTPPELHIVCANERVTALKGTYSWEYRNEDGTYTGVEADSAHPLECKEDMPDVGIVYATTSALHPRQAYLQFDMIPAEVVVRYWSEEEWNNVSAESKELEVLATEVDFADGSFTTSYSVELLEGNYIYEVTAKWSGSEEYSGTVHYSFYTVMGEYELVPISE